MRARDLTYVAAERATAVCQHFQPGRVASGWLRADLTPSQFLDVLVVQRLYKDATRFLAHAMPKREAVWWAVLCAREVSVPSSPQAIDAATRAAAAWVEDPSEENRRAALSAAKGAGFGTPAASAAMAAFVSGGSLGPPDGPVIPPKESSTAGAVVATVLLAVLKVPPEEAAERFRGFLDRGLEVASGANRWTEPVKRDQQSVGGRDRTNPRAATDGASPRPAPATPSQRSARWQWD